MTMKIGRDDLKRMHGWLRKDASSTWQCYEDETNARSGCWDEPDNRRYLGNIKHRAIVLDSLADILGRIIDGFPAYEEDEELAAKMIKTCTELDEGEEPAEMMKLIISCIGENRIPDNDEVKDIFLA